MIHKITIRELNTLGNQLPQHNPVRKMGKSRFSYKDFATNKLRYTNGKFIGWTKPTGILNIPYAKFRRLRTILFVPKCLLTKDCCRAISKLEQIGD